MVSRGALSVPAYRRLFAGQLVSSLGDGFTLLALPFAIAEVHGSASAIGAVLTARALPQVLFTLLGGAVGDRFAPSKILPTMDAVRCGCQGAVAALFFTGHVAIWQICVFMAVYGTASAFYYPASRALLPAIVPGDQLPAANSLSAMAFTASGIAGPLLAAVLLSVSSPGAAIAVDACSFAFSALMVFPLRKTVERPQNNEPVIRLLRSGWQEVRSRTWLWVGLIHAAAFQFLVLGSLMVLGPLIAVHRYGASRGWAYFLVASSLGSLVAGLFALRRAPRRPLRAGYGAIVLASAPLLAIGAGADFALVALAMAYYGAALTYEDVMWQSTIQRRVARSAQSRVAAFDLTISMGLRPVGLALAGPMAAVFGPYVVLVVCAVAASVLTCLVLLLPSVRDVRWDEPEAEAGIHTGPASSAGSWAEGRGISPKSASSGSTSS
jgi:MFS family permease